ncbi:unnamed protein product [Arctogadus glacialis]
MFGSIGLWNRSSLCRVRVVGLGAPGPAGAEPGQPPQTTTVTFFKNPSRVIAVHSYSGRVVSSPQPATVGDRRDLHP